jgi:hypothetical protein
MISPEEYIEQRLNEQISWYDNKSSTSQRWFKRLRFAEVLAAATIPFLSGFVDNSIKIKIAIGALGVVVAVIASLLGLLHLQEMTRRTPSICSSSASKLCCRGRTLSGCKP